MGEMMIELDNGRPGDRRGFVHKRLLRVAGGVISNLPVVGTPFRVARQAVSVIAGRPPARAVAPRSQVARTSLASAQGKETGRMAKFGGSTILDRAKGFLGFNGEEDCVPPFRRDPGTGKCKVFVGERAGPNGGAPVGDAVMGRYGAALQPGIMTIDRAVCLTGMQLGNDGLCYNKGQITNKQRMWPRGRRPLLTGGQMRAITLAAGAARQVSGATKRLQSLGLLKKPMARRAPKSTAVVLHDVHDHHHSDH